jgi:hypothetical protein
MFVAVYMRRPSIAALTSDQRKELITKITEDRAEFPYKTIAVEALACFNELIDKVRTSDVTFSQIKKMLEDRSEALKKLMQSH